MSRYETVEKVLGPGIQLSLANMGLAELQKSPRSCSRLVGRLLDVVVLGTDWLLIRTAS